MRFHDYEGPAQDRWQASKRHRSLQGLWYYMIEFGQMNIFCLTFVPHFAMKNGDSKVAKNPPTLTLAFTTSH